MQLPTDEQIKINRFYRNNQTLFIDLLNLVKQYPQHAVRMINAHGNIKRKIRPKYQYLKDWILQQTIEFIQMPKTLHEIIQWILMDRIDYAKCPICGKDIKTFTSKHCSSRCAGINPDTLIKRINTTNKLYGCNNVFQSATIKQKISDKLYATEGVLFTGQLMSKKKHTEQTCLRKYGVKNVNQCAEIKQRGINTALSRHDHLFNYCKYEYDNRKFDSSWELMYYIYLKDHNIPFEYHKSGLFFTYIQDGKCHRFYPDFIVNGEIHEIKGDQFFNDKGEPYNVQFKVWWKEKYQCMLDNNVKILRERDLIHVFEYYSTTYGKNNIQKYLICRNKIRV